MKPIDIKELYHVEKEEIPKLSGMLCRAFKDYPKLSGYFTDPKEKDVAVAMVVEYYGKFDSMFGRFYCLDPELNETVAVIHSDDVVYSEENIKKAGCESEKFLNLAKSLGDGGLKKWYGFFDELDRQESLLTFPEKYIYVDFLAVDTDKQGCGRGSMLIEAVCRKAAEMKLPVMLFTNGEKDVEFYKKHGFAQIGVTKSDEYRFENVYMLFDGKHMEE